MKFVVLEDDPVQSDLVCYQLRKEFGAVELVKVSSEEEFLGNLAVWCASPPIAFIVDMFVSNLTGDYARSGLRCLESLLLSPELSALPIIVRTALSEIESQRLLGDTPSNIIRVHKNDEAWLTAMRSLLLVIHRTATLELSNEVFVVHGRDMEARATVKAFIEKIGGRPIILSELASGAMTVIEKFEQHSSAGFAIVIVTPDDVGGLRNGVMSERPRQNVVFEMGYFFARLGRKRVCALLKGGVEFPSDINGVVYIPLDESEAWQFALIKELKEARMPLAYERILED